MDQAKTDNLGRPRSLYIDGLKGLTDDQLLGEAAHRIWLSAYANNNPRSDYHWQADATYDECQRRGKAELYSEAHRRASGS